MGTVTRGVKLWDVKWAYEQRKKEKTDQKDKRDASSGGVASGQRETFVSGMCLVLLTLIFRCREMVF